MLDKRAASIRDLLSGHGLDALLVTSPANLRYLCGFSGGSDGALVLTPHATIFLTDSRYTTQAKTEVTAGECREYAVQADGIVACLADCGVVRVGFEAEHLSCAALERLRERSADRQEWIALGRPLLTLRGIKDDGEIAAIERAAHLAADAFAEIEPLLKPGVAEREVALALEFALRRRGGDEKSFDLIVASGERGALPHGTASSRLLASGECVTIDFGVRLNGYCSDETVTVALGAPTAELERVHALVYRAQQEAIAAIRPGVELRAIDAIAREIIAAGGYGPCFGHGLGHGVGLEVHEYPTLSPRSTDTAQVGMVFTVEPGIYLPGTGGVRLEEMVVVTPAGCRRLTRLPKELRRL